MSWSVSVKDKPAAMKQALAKQFANAKACVQGNDHELKTVELAENLVSHELEFIEQHKLAAVEIIGGGSCSTVTPGGSSQVSITVTPLFGFLE